MKEGGGWTKGPRVQKVLGGTSSKISRIRSIVTSTD